MSKRIWNLKYVAGNPALFTKTTEFGDNPLVRTDALKSAEKLANNGWRVWIEHATSGKRIFESLAEQQHNAARNAARVIRFAEEHVPGFRRQDRRS
jgi:hypothetical protein